MRQWDEAILEAFPAVDVQHHPLAVDIGDLQMLGFLQAQTAGIDGGEEGVVMRGAYAAQEPPDFFTAEHRGQLLLALGMDQFEGMPVAMQDMLEEKPQPAVADPQGRGRPLIGVSPVEEIMLQIVLGDLIRGFMIKLHEHAHRTGVRFLGALTFAVELKGID